MEETDVSGKYIQANGLSKQYTESEIREDTRALADNQNLTYLHPRVNLLSTRQTASPDPTE